MRKFFLIIISVAFLFTNGFSQLRVHESQRYLETTDGKPFLWIGDTAWELFHKLNREEATEYLENRAAKGFSVIHAVVLAENNELRTPNSYGHLPLIDLDPAQPNEAYFEHVDFIVNKAGELGLVVGMLPTWGDKIESANPGAGPVVFEPQNANLVLIAASLNLKSENRPRVFVFTDINIDSGDPDDRQSLIHLLWYANELRIEGVVPHRWNASGLKACQLAADAYSKDYSKTL